MASYDYDKLGRPIDRTSSSETGTVSKAELVKAYREQMEWRDSMLETAQKLDSPFYTLNENGRADLIRARDIYTKFDMLLEIYLREH